MTSMILFQIELTGRQQRSRVCSKSEMYGVSGGDVQQPINHAQWFNGNKTQKLRNYSCLICGPTSQHAKRLEGKLIQRSFAACSVANFSLLQMQHVRFLAKWFDRNEATHVSSSPRRSNRIVSRASNRHLCTIWTALVVCAHNCRNSNATSCWRQLENPILVCTEIHVWFHCSANWKRNNGDIFSSQARLPIGLWYPKASENIYWMDIRAVRAILELWVAKPHGPSWF